MFDQNFGVAFGLQAFAILLVAYYVEPLTDVGVCCCIMGILTIVGLLMKETK